ncbi:MAG: hypothetical protein KGY99_11375, partial [Phycisphaerae bacterium]|nr:hypothetical protein [Phycisphaerae bacterium]
RRTLIAAHDADVVAEASQTVERLGDRWDLAENLDDARRLLSQKTYSCILVAFALPRHSEDRATFQSALSLLDAVAAENAADAPPVIILCGQPVAQKTKRQKASLMRLMETLGRRGAEDVANPFGTIDFGLQLALQIGRSTSKPRTPTAK